MDDLWIVAVLLFVRFIGNEAASALPIHRDRSTRFPLTGTARAVFRLAPPFAVFLAYKGADDAINSFDLVIVGLLVVMAVVFLVVEPGEINTSQIGLVQSSYSGLRSRHIPWTGSGALILPLSREVVVTHRDGASVVHSRYHVAQQQFVEVLRRNRVPIVQGRATT